MDEKKKGSEKFRIQNSGSEKSSEFNGGIRNQDFGHRLRNAREKAGFTRDELSQISGISKTSLQNYELGHLPKGSHLKTLCEVLNVSADWLLWGEGPKYRGEKTEEKIVKISEKIDTSLVKEVVQTVEEFLQEQSISLSPAKKAELIALIIEEIQDYDRKPSEERILRLIKLAS